MSSATRPAGQIQAVGGPPAEEPSAISRDLELILRLVESLQHGTDRRDSAERFVRMLTHMFPEHQIILAMGSMSRCTLIVESNIGQVAVDTPLGRQVTDHWPNCDWQGRAPFYSLPLPGRHGQVAWIAIENASAVSHRLDEILQRSQEVFGTSLWSRPRFVTGFSSLWTDKSNRVKLIVSAVFVCFLMMFPIRYRIGCDAVIEPQKQRLVAAPFDAQLDDCFVRPGDSVQSGQQLALLDGRPLRIERESLRADLEKAKKEYDVALASNKIADGQLARLERDRIQHQINLIDDRLERLTVKSPMDGIVVSGDLHKAQGVPFSMGEALFEVAPLDEMVFEVEIPETEVGYVSPQSGLRIRVPALGRTYDGCLERVYPQSEIRDEKNVFVGVWTVENSDRRLRPGMEASAVVYGPIRPAVWGWLRRAYEGCIRAIGW